MPQTNKAIQLAVVITAAIALLTGCSASTAEEPPTQVVEEAPESSAEETAPDNTSAEDLVAAVQTNIDENFPGGITAGSPLFAVTELEPIGSDTLRAHVQESLNDEQREEIARHMFNMGDMDGELLSVVVVRDTSGKDSNHYR